jgi:thioredoxin-dependent peroxiredoxin
VSLGGFHRRRTDGIGEPGEWSRVVIETGSQAPDFTLETDAGEPVTLSALRGRKVILYFYPKDNTPGCTIQACDFRDAMPRFEGVDAVVLGVSADSVASHAKFRRLFDLTFPLLADVEHEVAEAYGVWGRRKTFGVSYEGIERSTFLIDEEGVVAGVWRKVKPKGHMEMLAELLGA